MAGANLSPVGEWDACGNRFYSKAELYQMAWSDVNLDNLRVACARYGGPIATIRDDRKMVLVSGGITQPLVKIYTSAGVQQAVFIWDKGSIEAMGWTSEEDLMIVEQTGEVHLYNMFGTQLPRHFSMGSEVQREGILDCQLFGDGLVVLTKGLQLWAVSGLAEPRPQKLASPALKEAPSCMAIFQPRHTLSGCLEVLLAVGNTVMTVDVDSAEQTAAGVGNIQKLSIAPNGQFVAAYTADGRLKVWVADFTKALSEFATQSDKLPEQLDWCGTDSVVMCWQDILLMVGPYGDWIKHNLEFKTVLVSECDGIRLVSAEQHELLSRVPDSLTDIFKLGSTAPGALLLDARQLFERQNARADNALRSIVGQLPEAVTSCVDAAGAELDPVRQAALMKAGCYGRAFCPAGSYPRKRILQVCQSLRVLNALRGSHVGIPLTLAQLEALTPAVLVSRLINARHHLLALRIAEMLNMDTDKVLVHWACQKISASLQQPDDQLKDTLTSKLQKYRGIRYSLIAGHAESVGRKGLATLLLEYETCAADQVPLLLSLGEMEGALTKAIDSGDTDLVYLAIFRMYRKGMPLKDFLETMSSNPLAKRLFISYCHRREPELLEQIYLGMGTYDGVGHMRLCSALRKANKISKANQAGSSSGHAALISDNSEVVQLLVRASEQYAQTKEHAFQSKASAEYAKLRTVQAELEQEAGQACFLGCSVTQTVQQCLRLGNARAAERVRQIFKLPDKRFGWIKVQTLATLKDWEGLEALAKEKKNVLPIPVYIAACKSNGAPTQATARLVARLPDASRKAEEYAALGMFQEAAETAATVKDSAMLSKIQGMVGTSSPLGATVAGIRDRLTAVTR
ncbi:MAG: vacuolar sorting-associated 16 protein [Trebouxia sp. A1-2]|nr:MAG: vacuolar sorting-associated 16 protein [Trebouxia sp. A1-2]